MDKERSVVGHAPAPEERFAYAASEVFAIVSPYVFHTHAARVFSDISAALRRAQEASADVVARLEASQMAKEHERHLRATEARRYVARLKELQELMKARAQREVEGALARKSLNRRLGEEISRSAQLEKRLADTRDELQRLRQDFESERCALEEKWRSTLDQAIVAAREEERSKANGKVEAFTIKRLRSLSSEVTELKRKLKSLQAENISLLEALGSRISPPPFPPTSCLSRRRAKPTGSEMEEEEAVVSADGEASSCSGADPLLHSGTGLADVVSGLADRIKRATSEHFSGVGLQQQRVSSRQRCGDEKWGGDDDDDDDDDGDDGDIVGGGVHPPAEPMLQHRRRRRRQQLPPTANTAAAAGGAKTARSVERAKPPGDEYRPAPDIPANLFGEEAPREFSGGGGGNDSIRGGRRRGLGSLGSPFVGGAPGGVPALKGSHLVPGELISAVNTLRSSSRWQHQRPLGGSCSGSGNCKSGADSNVSSIGALMASGEFFPAEVEVKRRRGFATTTRRKREFAGHSGGARAAREETGRARDASGVGRGGAEGRGGGGGGGGGGGRGGQLSRATASLGDPAAVTAAADGVGRQFPAVRLRPALSFADWQSSPRRTDLRDPGNSSRFAERGEAWVCRRVPGTDTGSGTDSMLVDEEGEEGDEDNERDDEEMRAGKERDPPAAEAGVAKGHAGASNGAAAGSTSSGGDGGDAGDAAAKVARMAYPGDGLSLIEATTATYKEPWMKPSPQSPDLGRSTAMSRDVLAAGARAESTLLLPNLAAGAHRYSSTIAAGPGAGGNSGKRLNDLFPTSSHATAEVEAAAGESRGKQRLGLDDLLRDMSMAAAAEGTGEGDNAAGGSIAAACRGDCIDVVKT